jgi:hypothetical protein
MLIIETASNPCWNDANKTSIQLTVKFTEFEEILPFTATPNDSMPYGVELYNRAVAGEFGEVAPYVAPPEVTQPTTQGAQTL